MIDAESTLLACTKLSFALIQSILHAAKACFPDDIQYIRDEIAMNDLGTRVRFLVAHLCSISFLTIPSKHVICLHLTNR